MRINYSTINKALDNAYDVLSKVVPEFKKPIIREIKVGKSRTHWATISKHGTGDFTLRVSNVYESIADEDAAKQRLESTIIHEVIHTLPNCFNHGYYFKKWAARVNFNYPQYSIQRCTSMEDFGIKRKQTDYKYKLTCSCGKEFLYKKKRWWFDSLSGCTCPHCKGHEFKLSVI